MMLGDELEKTQTAAKGDIRRLSVELQGMRDEQTALARQAAKMNVSTCSFSFVIDLQNPRESVFLEGTDPGWLPAHTERSIGVPQTAISVFWSLGDHSVPARVCSGNNVHSLTLSTKDMQKLYLGRSKCLR